MNPVPARCQQLLLRTHSLFLLLVLVHPSAATVYDFAPDGQEYSGDILGKNPLFVPGAVRSLPQFNNLYSTSNNSLIHDEFEVGAGDPASFRVTGTGGAYYTTWENFSPTITSWVNARDGFKFPAGSALGGEYSGGLAGETIKFRAYTYPLGSGLYTELDSLPFVDEMSSVVATDGETISFRFDSLAADARSFAAIRTTGDGQYITSYTVGMNTSSIELTTVADSVPPPFRHSPTQFDFADVGVSYPLGAITVSDAGQAGLDNVNAALDSSHGFHDEEFVIGRPNNPELGFGVGGISTNGYPDQYLVFQGSEGYVNWWVNAKEGNMFPQDAAIGVGQYNPNFTAADNGGNPVEVIIRAYAEPIVTGSFEELAGLTLVGEAKGLGVGTFNTPPVLELTANAKSFTVHTGDGNGNFHSFFNTSFNSYSWTTLNEIFVDTVPDEAVALPGDYNGDQMVDAADYTIWRDTLNSTTDLRADGDDSGTVDQGDYGVWKMHFGESSGGGANALAASGGVPEPGALAIFAIAALASTPLLRLRDKR